MNTRLLELAQQAEESANLGNAIDIKLMMQNYAELIIQECIKRIEGTTAPKIENMDLEYARWWEGYDDRGADSIEMIKKHFGIE